MQDVATDIQTLAAEAASWFETASRDEEDPHNTRYTRKKDGAPEWIVELVYTAHGDFGPDDWRYDTIRAALNHIEENGYNEDTAFEFADGNVDTYNGERFAWLASNLNRAGYCDETAEEMGYNTLDDVDGIVGLIGLGQYAESREVFDLVVQALSERGKEHQDA